MVVGAMKAVFVNQAPDQVCPPLAAIHRDAAQATPNCCAIDGGRRDDVQEFPHFQVEHWRRIWSANMVERFIFTPKERLTAH